VVNANAKLVAAAIPRKSAIVRDAIRKRKLEAVAARYSLDWGRVTVLV
jgi:hypothetical protein